MTNRGALLPTGHQLPLPERSKQMVKSHDNWSSFLLAGRADLSAAGHIPSVWPENNLRCEVTTAHLLSVRTNQNSISVSIVSVSVSSLYISIPRDERTFQSKPITTNYKSGLSTAELSDSFSRNHLPHVVQNKRVLQI